MTADRQDPLPYEEPKGHHEEPKGHHEEPTGHRAARGQQKGAQQHAEGMQGPVARAHFLEQLRSGPSGEPPADPPQRVPGLGAS